MRFHNFSFQHYHRPGGAFNGTLARSLSESGERPPPCQVLVDFVFERAVAGGHRTLNEEDVVFAGAGRSGVTCWPEDRVLLPHLQKYVLQDRFWEKIKYQHFDVRRHSEFATVIERVKQNQKDKSINKSHSSKT